MTAWRRRKQRQLGERGSDNDLEEEAKGKRRWLLEDEDGDVDGRLEEATTGDDRLAEDGGGGGGLEKAKATA